LLQIRNNIVYGGRKTHREEIAGFQPQQKLAQGRPWTYLSGGDLVNSISVRVDRHLGARMPGERLWPQPEQNRLSGGVYVPQFEHNAPVVSETFGSPATAQMRAPTQPSSVHPRKILSSSIGVN